MWRPTVRFVPETCYVQRTRHEVQSRARDDLRSGEKVNRVPCGTVNQCVTEIQMQSLRVTVTKMVRKPITETVTVCETTMIPHSSTVTVPVTKYRPVTETVTRQTSVCVPYQVPVTVMTTQMRPVVASGAGGPERTRLVPDRRTSPQGGL